MTKDKIVERIERNLYYMRCVVTNDNVRKELEANNDILNELMHIVYGEPEELTKPVLGDVVEVYIPECDYRKKAVFLADGPAGGILMVEGGTIMTMNIENDCFELKKTGEYVDILGMLEKVGL